MSDPIITVILTQLATIMEQQIRKEVKLISGVEKEVKKLTSTFKSIKAVLVDAEKRQLKEETVKVWLEKLKDVCYDTEDVLSEWITSMEKADIEGLEKQSSPSPTDKVSFFLTMPLLGFKKVTIRRDIALRIKDINERLDTIAIEKDRYKFNEFVAIETPIRLKTTSFVDVLEVRGRDADKSTLISKLLSERNQDKSLNLLSIMGMGGIGKTTLAQIVYNSNAIINHFERRIWVCVSDPFDEVRIAKAIVEDIEGSAPYLFELETLLRKIRSYIAQKKFLLVLDDVWNEDYRKWEQLLNSLTIGAPGSIVLVTTRNERIAKVMGSKYELRLGQLSAHDSWSLFQKIAFFERSRNEVKELEEIGKKIADKCKGLPLTVKTIGSLMRFKTSLKEWEGVLSNELWELEEGEGLFPPLMLSYYDLPPKIKQCFSFCAFFPKDYVIEATNLIQLWMAQGYLNSTENVEMEVTGQEYLQSLAMRSFFQDMVKDKDGKRIISLKMHDIVHDFAKHLTKNECSVIEIDRLEQSQKKSRHLTLIREENAPFPTSIPNVEKLHTFWVQSFYDSPPIISQLDKIGPGLIHRLSCIKSLDLSRNRIGELPDNIGKMIKLKYLNLSHNPFWELPSSLCDLFNLQTLKLSACDHLRKLPQEIGKLTKLRHLELDGTDSLKTLPKGIGNLNSLQTLSKFTATCGVEGLRHLNNLRGFLKIEGLGCVANADEAMKAELEKKIYISDLDMDFSPWIQNGRQNEVIEALHPNENLRFLQMSSYGGDKLPNWITKLTNLQKLFLKDCPNCVILAHLGRLPSLSTLEIEGIKNLKFLGLEFLGINVNDSNFTAFPKLKKLKFSKMESWEEWDLIRGNGDEGLKIMPRLRCLKISDCGKLKALPYVLLLHNTPIVKLRIHNCAILHQQYQKRTGESWTEISHISKLRIS